MRVQCQEVFRLQDGAWLVAGVWTGDDPARVEPFEAIELELGALWPEAGGGSNP